MANPQDAEKVIRAYIEKNLLPEEASLTDSSPLFESGYLDSFGIVELLAFLEKEFKLRFSAWEVTVENIGSIRRIAAFIARKRGKL